MLSPSSSASSSSLWSSPLRKRAAMGRREEKVFVHQVFGPVEHADVHTAPYGMALGFQAQGFAIRIGKDKPASSLFPELGDYVMVASQQDVGAAHPCLVVLSAARAARTPAGLARQLIEGTLLGKSVVMEIEDYAADEVPAVLDANFPGVCVCRFVSDATVPSAKITESQGLPRVAWPNERILLPPDSVLDWAEVSRAGVVGSGPAGGRGGGGGAGGSGGGGGSALSDNPLFQLPHAAALLAAPVPGTLRQASGNSPASINVKVLCHASQPLSAADVTAEALPCTTAAALLHDLRGLSANASTADVLTAAAGVGMSLRMVEVQLTYWRPRPYEKQLLQWIAAAGAQREPVVIGFVGVLGPSRRYEPRIVVQNRAIVGLFSHVVRLGRLAMDMGYASLREPGAAGAAAGAAAAAPVELPPAWMPLLPGVLERAELVECVERSQFPLCPEDGCGLDGGGACEQCGVVPTRAAFGFKVRVRSESAAGITGGEAVLAAEAVWRDYSPVCTLEEARTAPLGLVEASDLLREAGVGTLKLWQVPGVGLSIVPMGVVAKV